LNEWVISLVAALAAVGALVFTGYSFKRLRKTEQVRLSESILKDVRNSINEYNILSSQTVSNTEHSIRNRKCIVSWIMPLRLLIGIVF
jgi:hypothetical protein